MDTAIPCGVFREVLCGMRGHPGGCLDSEGPRASGRETPGERGWVGWRERARAEKRQAALADSAHPLGITHWTAGDMHPLSWCRGNGCRL